MWKVTVVFVVAVAFVAGFFVGKTTSPKPKTVASVPIVAATNEIGDTKPKTIERRDIPVAGTPKGAANAPITIVEFAEFQCPFSARAAATIDELLNEYPGKIRFYFRHYPLPMHIFAQLAAEASLAAEGDGKFWEMHEKLFANSRNLKREDLEKYAEELGLDMTRFKQALDTHQYQERVEGDLETALKVGVRGTPAFFINGRLLSGARPLEEFKAVVEEELAGAEAVVAKKLPSAQRR